MARIFMPNVFQYELKIVFKVLQPFITIHRCPFCSAIPRSKHIITVPSYIKDELKRKQKKDGIKFLKSIQEKSRLGNQSIPLISCKVTEFDHHLGRVYQKNETIPLASKGWFHTKSHGDYFVIRNYGENPSSMKTNKSKSFADFNLNPNVLDGIEKLGFKTPTFIQSEAIPVLLKRDNVVCCAETGSGKTLSYLAPMLHNILEDRQRLSVEPDENSPYGLILVPGRELAVQVAEVLGSISSYCGLGVKVLTGGNSLKSKLSKETNRADIVVGTMGIVQKFISTKAYNTNFLQHVVIDECDTMVDDTFIEPLLKILNNINIQGKYKEDSMSTGSLGTQLTLVGATLPKGVNNAFRDFLDPETLTWIKTPHLHKLMPHIKQSFLRLDALEKSDKLVKLLKRELASKTPTMIFCNRNSAAHYVSKMLDENGIPNGALHGDSLINERQKQFDAFQSGDLDVLVCTDLGSRGLDTIRVKHVINFEFPMHMSDYIHRVGRTGRVGTEGGKCTNFVATKIEVPLVQQIELAARMAASLPNVNANIRREIEEYISSRKSNRPKAKDNRSLKPNIN